MSPFHTGEFLRYSVLAAWGAVVLLAIILRYNSAKLSGTVRRYLAYIGYIDPRDLPGSAAELSVQDQAGGNSRSKSIAV
jgi:hypothetical protein